MKPEEVESIGDAISDLASAVHTNGMFGPDASPIHCLSSAVADIAWVIKDVAEAIDRLAIAVEDMRQGGDV